MTCLARLNCFPSLQKSEIWNLLEPGLIDSHLGVLYDAWARAINEALGGLNTSASQDYSENERNVAASGPGRFVSTASVARDMRKSKSPETIIPQSDCVVIHRSRSCFESLIPSVQITPYHSPKMATVGNLT